MCRKNLRQAARALLVLLVLSWIAPDFAWAVHTDHHELQHAGGAADHNPPEGDAEHDLAHTSLGHVLGHLPAAPSAVIDLTLPHAPSAVITLVMRPRASTPPDRLYRPPRSFFG